jgi:ATP-dependent DNA helicase PIF1
MFSLFILFSVYTILLILILKQSNNNKHHLPYKHTILKIDFKYLPLTLSWAMSIHKSQGATIDLLEVDLGDSIFACGQAYVALSRAKNSDSVKITKFNPSSVNVSKSVIEFYDTYK